MICDYSKYYKVYFPSLNNVVKIKNAMKQTNKSILYLYILYTEANPINI